MNGAGLEAGGWLEPPVSDTPWSKVFVMQSLEILPLCLDAGGEIQRLRPAHADSLRVGWRPQAEPHDLVAGALAPYGLKPSLVHSTSWRHEGGTVVLTYIAVVSAADVSRQRGTPLLPEAIGRVALARGGATAPPPTIGIDHVVEHALRHLSWLSKDDPVVGVELSSWVDALAGHEPEPFRSL